MDLEAVLVFASLVLSLLSTAPLTWTQKVVTKLGVLQRENGRGGGLGTTKAPQLILIPHWPLVYPFTCSCITHVPGVRVPWSRNLSSECCLQVCSVHSVPVS